MEVKPEQVNSGELLTFYQGQVNNLIMDKAVLFAKITKLEKSNQELTKQLTAKDDEKKGGK